MLDKVYQQKQFIRSASEEEQILREMSRKGHSIKDNDKQREEAFQLVLDQKIAEEKAKAINLKKSRKNDDPGLVLVPMYVIPPKISDDIYIKMSRYRKGKCSKCGSVVLENEMFELKNSSDKSKAFVCRKCMNKDVTDILMEFI